MPRLQTLCRVCWLRKERLSPPATRFHTSSRRDVYLGPPKELSPRVGPKRRRKVQAAQRQWDQKARRISNGTEPSMLKILEDRGYVKEIAGERNQLDAMMTRRRIGVYVGFDPTGPSLHVGHLIPFMALFWMHVHGYYAVSLLGAATAKFGDPTGRTTSRPVRSMSQATADMTSMHLQLKKLARSVLRYGEVYGYMEEYTRRRSLEKNSVWLNKVPILEFMKVVCGVRMAGLVNKDTYKTRMESKEGMSYGEFSYALLQAYDWWTMHQRMGVRLQIGGSDQMGNIITGIETIKYAKLTHPNAKIRNAPDWIPYGITTPLLTTASGEKLGKSDGNAVWLDKSMTSVFDLYQYFMRMPDSAVEQQLKLLTFIPLREIDEIMKEHMQDPGKRLAHRRLAYDVVRLVHGLEEADATKLQHEALFQKKIPIGILKPEGSKLEKGKKDKKGKEGEEGKEKITWENAPMPRTILPRSLVATQPFSRVLVAAGFVKSAQEGQRLVNQQGVYVGSRPGQKGGMREDDLQFTPIKTSFPRETNKYLINGDLLILRRGKWQVKIISLVPDEEFAKMDAQVQDVPLWAALCRKRELEKKASEKAEKVEA